MAANKDFIVDLSVDQRGAQTYVDEMTEGAAKLDRIANEINRLSFRGIRPRANASRMTEAMRREAERRRRDQGRVVKEIGQIGQGLQRAVVREIGYGLARPTASTGKLAKVTASDRNAGFTNSNNRVAIGVGRFSWLLTNKQVRYALAIEGGSDAAVGRRITGLWLASTGRPTGFGRPTKTQTFVAMNAREASKVLAAAGRKRYSVSGIITKPILAHEDYKIAVRKFQPQKKAADAIRRIYGA